MCKDLHLGYVYSLSTVDKIKEIALEIGWDGEKTPRARKFLSDLKDLTSEFIDFPFQDIKKRISLIIDNVERLGGNTDKIVIFIHSREPEEIERFKVELNAETLLVRRPEVEDIVASNHADANYLEYEYDYIVPNYYGLEELRCRAKEFLHILKVI